MLYALLLAVWLAQADGEAPEKPADDVAARASTVTLSGTMTLEEIRAAIEKQTGNVIADYRQQLGQAAPNPLLKVEIKNAPFWPAMDAILDQANLGIYHFSGQAGLALQERAEAELPRRNRGAYAGPLRLEVTRLVSEREPTLEAAAGKLAVNLEISWEPRLALLRLVQPVAQLTATDNQGARLETEIPEGALEASVQGGGTAAQLMIPFTAPPRTTTTIASLKGTLTVQLAGKIETFEFDRLPEAAQGQFKGRELNKSAVTVVLDRVRKNNDLWEVWLRVRYDGEADATSQRLNWIYQNEAYLLGPDQMKIENAGYESTGADEREVGLSYKFELPDSPEGYKFVYKTPATIQSVPVAYELKNIPLP